MRKTVEFLGLILLSYLFVTGGSGEGGGKVGPNIKPPIPGIDKAILIVEKQEERRNLTPKQLAIFASGDVDDFCTANGFKKKTLDVDATVTPGPWKDAFDAVKAKPNVKYPWLVISNTPAGKGYDGILAADNDAMMELLNSKK